MAGDPGLWEQFSAGALERGSQYAREQRVQILSDEGWPVEALVRGTYPYQVLLFLDPNRGFVSECTCPVGDECKHGAALGMVLLQTRPELTKAQRPTPELAVTDWLAAVATAPRFRATEAPPTHEVVYLLGEIAGRPTLEPRQARRGKRGRLLKPTSFPFLDLPHAPAPDWLRGEELRRVLEIQLLRERAMVHGEPFEPFEASLVRELADTGRLVWQPTGRPVAYGPARQARLTLATQDDATWRVALDPPQRCLRFSQAHYLDELRDLVGPLEADVPGETLGELLAAPPIPAEMLPDVRRALSTVVGRELPAAAETRPTKRRTPTKREAPAPAPELTPRLRLEIHGTHLEATVQAAYGDALFPMAEWEGAGAVVRDLATEHRALLRYRELAEMAPPPYLRSGSEALASFFAAEVAPSLMAEGWQVEVDEAFPVKPPAALEIEEALTAGGGDWMSYALGVVVDGRRHSLLPLLLAALRDRTLDLSELESRPDHPGVWVTAGDRARLHLPADRLRGWLRPLLELRLRGLEEGALKLPGTALLDDDLLGRFGDAEERAAMRERLGRLTELAPRDEPPGFVGTLRGYQREGLAWLSFLHQLGYGGLLADDMGLGKTVQVLAFLEDLRREGELAEAPALVVAPRTVVDNWHREAPRFAPQLEQVVHLGPGRATSAEGLRGAHLILTSYQTLLRDIDWLAGIEWSSAIFDEAQALKNPATKVRKAAARLRARSRLCITGTPIENHLLELWSQVDLAMPGLLGRRKAFQEVVRTPIETSGDERALEGLRRRVRPFLLRRSKDEVALELPPKTEVLERVELGGRQRDLYESLRLALDKDVRDALRSPGAGGSSFVVLDALLRLRQVCCDPRLVKIDAARKVKDSAKLDRLAELLQELSAEGRYTLIFSQFTSMLALIGERCRELGIGYLELTGKTTRRDEIVERFQAGEAPVFLISLKAGGAGINLTRADTVIHYDPWWNPAVEAQATDRAHRIGQDKPVFVYKMVAAGSVEDRIVELQRGKQRLSDLAMSEGGLSHLSAEDLDALFQPL